MKRILAFIMAMCMTMSIAACSASSSSTTSETSSEPSATPMPEDSSASSDTSTADLSDLNGLKVEQELFDVEITIPADLAGDVTQADIDDAVASGSVFSGKINEDGSVTYVMSKSQHREMMNSLTESMNETLAGIPNSEDYPTITAIEVNDDFTNFTVTTTSTDLSLSESFLTLSLYIYGGMYNAFNGTSIDNIHVDYVNSDSGEIIDTADSSEMGE